MPSPVGLERVGSGESLNEFLVRIKILPEKRKFDSMFCRIFWSTTTAAKLRNFELENVLRDRFIMGIRTMAKFCKHCSKRQSFR